MGGWGKQVCSEEGDRSAVGRGGRGERGSRGWSGDGRWEDDGWSGEGSLERRVTGMTGGVGRRGGP